MGWSSGMTPKDKAFDLETFLSSVDGGRTISKYRKDETVFAQGDPFDQQGSFAFTLTVQGTNAASVNLAGSFAARSSLVLQTHGCHRLCRSGYGPSRPLGYHRHTQDCVPTRCREWNWGWLPWRWLNVRPD